MFGTPTHSNKENDALYASLNEQTAQLLAEGKSVIFDTNFNFVKDRLYLRTIADRCGAETTVIWVATPKTVAKARAVRDSNLRNGYKFLMSEGEFDTIASHLEPPSKDEKVVKIDGVKLDRAALIQLLKQ
jgi:adenylate kinase family enzyme